MQKDIYQETLNEADVAKLIAKKIYTHLFSSTHGILKKILVLKGHRSQKGKES